MTNVEYLENIEKEIQRSTAFSPEFKMSMYMKSIARSLAAIADSYVEDKDETLMAESEVSEWD